MSEEATRQTLVLCQIRTLGENCRSSYGVPEVWNAIVEHAPKLAKFIADKLLPEEITEHRMANFNESIKDGLITAATMRRVLRDVDLDDRVVLVQGQIV